MFDVMEIPFHEIDNQVNLTYLPNSDTVNSDPDSNTPLYKFQVFQSGHYEIRVKGNSNLMYGIYIYHYANFRSTLSTNDSIRLT